jgi:hypothetical protein
VHFLCPPGGPVRFPGQGGREGGRAGISVAAAREALLAHEKSGIAARVKSSRPGIPDTWTPVAVSAATDDEAPPAGTRDASYLCRELDRQLRPI